MRLAATAICTAMVLSACGSSQSTEAASEGSTTTSNVTQTTPATAPTAASEPATPVAGGDFTFAAPSEISGLDPIALTGYADFGGIPAAAIYDTLMRFDEDGQIVPHLAESLEPVNDEGTVWELRLRKGVVFHDGETLDADAVVYNISRHQDPASASRFIREVIPIEDMQADGLTVTFTLAHPWAAFPAIFTHVVGMIASPTAVEELGPDYNANPVGAGPFVFDSWVPNDRLVLTKNPDYWQEGLPLLDRWIQRPLPDDQTRFAAMTSGEVDVAFARFLTPSLEAMREDEDVHVDTVFGDMGDGLVMNTQVPPFDDVRVRQAISHFIDYDGVNAASYFGAMPDHRGIFTPDSEYFSGVEQPQFDVEAGQALLDDYLADTGQESVAVTFLGIPARRQHNELLLNMLRRPGLDVSLEAVDPSAFLPAVRSGDYQIATYGITLPSDPDLMLWNNFHSASAGNVSQLDDAEVDAAIERGQRTLDPAERATAYAELESLLVDLVPMVLITPSHQSLVIGNDVHGLEPYEDQRFLSDTIWVE